MRGTAYGQALRRSLIALGATLAVFAMLPVVATAQRKPPVKQAVATGGGGAAATVDLKATKAAIGTLRKGGNAVDAAVAAAAVLGVTEPFSSGIGGGGFMLIRTPDGKVTTIDGRETAPAAMVPTSFFVDGVPLAFEGARYSGLSIGTPGTVATWVRALDRYGSKPLSELLERATRVARKGFRVDPVFAAQIDTNLGYFDDVPATARIYLDRDGSPRDVGSRLRNPDMARAYERIAKRGAPGFYRGPIAKAIAKTAQEPPVVDNANHVFRPGLITTKDIAGYRVRERPPVKVGYRGLDVYGMRPPSSGGSTVGEALNILEGYEPLGTDRPQILHRFLEASRYAYADRAAYLADPDFFDVPLEGLLSDSYAAERRALITGQAAQPGRVNPGVPPGAPAPQVTSAESEGTSTTHLTVADRRGTVVSYTFTIESTGGSGLVVPGWGFLLNNELTDFAITTPSAPNAAEGGKRPRSSMAPTLVTRSNGKPVLALGSPGGSTIITTVLQILIDKIDGGMTLPEAIALPRATQQNSPVTRVEPGFLGTPYAAALRDQYGHQFEVIDPPEIGAAVGIEFLPGGMMRAAAEPQRRGGGSALAIRGR